MSEVIESSAKRQKISHSNGEQQDQLQEQLQKHPQQQPQQHLQKQSQDQPQKQLQEQPHEQPAVPDERSRKCPYLDTINRNLLDFDFEKLCSVSLSKINVYACLVCGKYFQGRGIKTHAYTHSVSVDHHVFLNLETLHFYCLPDNYEIIDSSLDDITYVLKPTFTPDEIRALGTNSKLCRAYDGTTYLSGIVGLNNIKANDYCNVVLQALSHVSHLRNHFLDERNYNKLMHSKQHSPYVILPQRFGELLRKLWNPRNFKAHVSPHEMLQAVVLCSKKRFTITAQDDPINFLSWFLNTLHQSLKSSKTPGGSMINQCFQGAMKVFSRRVLPIEKSYEEKLALMEQDEYKEKCEEINYLYLTLDLPPTPLFKDDFQENIIPQVALQTILNKFDGISEKEYSTYKESQLKRFQLIRLPRYLILYIKRFTKNTFFVEKNPTIVNFPIKDLDLTEYLAEEVREKHPRPVYDLVANIIHEGTSKDNKGIYKVHILHEGSGKWFELQDLHVVEVLPQMITLSESYIQVWKRQETV